MKEYSECGTACPLTCENPDPVLCILQCVPGKLELLPIPLNCTLELCYLPTPQVVYVHLVWLNSVTPVSLKISVHAVSLQLIMKSTKVQNPWRILCRILIMCEGIGHA